MMEMLSAVAAAVVPVARRLDVRTIAASIVAAGESARNAIRKVEADERTRFQKMIRQGNRKGADVSTRPDQEIEERLARARHNLDQAQMAKARQFEGDVQAILAEQRGDVDRCWRETLAAIDTLAGTEQTIAGTPGLSMTFRRTLHAAELEMGTQYRAWRMRAFPPARPPRPADDED